LLPYLPQIQSEKIVLIHLSSRYSTVEALKILNQKIPQEFRDRVELFPGR
jgi:ribonuclease Z